MENQKASYSKSRTNHAGITATLFFTLFNLILLSMLSWVLLEIWFSMRIILLHDTSGSYIIQKILSNNLILIKQHHAQYIDMALTLSQHVRDTVESFVGKYIDDKIFLNVTEIILTRVCLFIEFIPFMLVILFIFIIDGLVLRDKRKFQGARESTFLFHRLKLLARVSFFTLFLIYMVNPYPILPSLFLIPMAVLSSLFTMLSIKSFKKYL